MGRRTKDADWLSDWTIVWKWRKVDTPSPVDSTDCCLNICKYIGWIDKYLYLSIQPIHLQILRRRCCLIPRCWNKKQLGFCISGRSRKIMVADQVFVTWARCNLVLTNLKHEEVFVFWWWREGKEKSQAVDRPGVHHAFREGEVCVNVKNTFEDCQVGFFLDNGN